MALPKIATPAYVVDEVRLRENLETAARVRAATGCRMLLATKAFAMPAAFPLMRPFLDGTTASGLYEARLGREEFGKEVHVYAPAYTEAEVQELTHLADHITFNSVDQVRRFAPLVRAAGRGIRTGVRINPGYSCATVGGSKYDPCSPLSRFGVPLRELDALPWELVDFLHVHALCEADHRASALLMDRVVDVLGPYLARVKAINLGGGHFLNKRGFYNPDALMARLRAFRDAFPHLDVILEPGSGLVVDAGYLVTSVLDLVDNGAHVVAVLDSSFTCHMPDVLTAPYTPSVLGATTETDAANPFGYLLGGKTCMTGDLAGPFFFAQALKPGDKIVLGDMLQYTFVQATTFNGTPLPDLGWLDAAGAYRVERAFGYADFRTRLG